MLAQTLMKYLWYIVAVIGVYLCFSVTLLVTRRPIFDGRYFVYSYNVLGERWTYVVVYPIYAVASSCELVGRHNLDKVQMRMEL